MSPGAAAYGEHPFVVAHRGASADRPEHTLAAYELALQEGADGVECDVRLTRDGHLVCVHDRRIDRTSTGTGLVSDMTLAELRQFNWGAWHSSWRPDGDVGGIGLLTLEDLLQLVLDCQRPVKVFIETKHPVRYGALVESKVLALLHRYGLAFPASADLSRAVVMSFSAAAVWRIRRAAAADRSARGDFALSRRRRRDHGRCHRRRSLDHDPAGTPRVGGPRRRSGPGDVLLDGGPLRGCRVLPRCRGRLDRDQPSGPHQDLAAQRADGGRPGLRPLGPNHGWWSRACWGIVESVRNASNNAREASGSHTTTSPASLTVSSPTGTVIVVSAPRSAHASAARLQT